ncbi:GTPase [Klebsiella pneumoniae]|nr:GTPase [Klebsiella pneumoniae]SWK14212.1 GTPase [Klebsiella pneumoniae]
MQKTDGLLAIEKPLASLPPTLRSLILKRLRSLTQYEPVIGIMGKSGSGKSSLCNALFQGEVTPVSDVAACTRDVLRFRFRNGNHSLMIVDLPGVGESEQRDEEYTALYRRILPELDLVCKRAARTVLTGMCYSVGSATRQGSSSLTRFIGQSAMTSRT